MAKKEPKEVVVVGSKIKDVIKKAGVYSDEAGTGRLGQGARALPEVRGLAPVHLRHAVRRG